MLVAGGRYAFSIVVLAVLRPHGQDVLVLSDRNDDAADLAPDVPELFTDKGHNEVLPVQGSETLHLAQAHDPLASVAVLGVLPRRRDAFSE